jgi:hypothetical protein
MPNVFNAVGLARTAQRHLSTARDLEARWSDLTREQQQAVRGELRAMRQAAGEVQHKLSFGVRGFVHEFRAAKEGVEPGPLDEGRPLGESVKALAAATRRMHSALNVATEFPPPGDDAA